MTVTMIEIVFCLRPMILTPAENYSHSKETHAHKGKVFLHSRNAFCVFWYLCTGIRKVFN